MQKVSLFIVLIFSACCCHAQYQEAARFTTADGLPSDHVYHCVEDNQGFLWVATDQGLARFDGKHFHVFTTEQGLPDNEVLEVVKEKNGRIWVSCFKQIPAYYDSLANRFVIAYKDSSGLPDIIGTGAVKLYALSEGGVEYRNNLGAFVFVNKRCIKYLNETILALNHDGTALVWHEQKPSALALAEIRLLKDSKMLGHIPMKGWIYYIEPMEGESDKLYVSIGIQGKWLRLSNFRYDPLQFDIDTLKLHSTMSRYTTSSKYLIAVTQKGALDVYEKESFTYLFTLQGDYKSNNGYEDRNGNIWICTMDKGLIMYRVPRIQACDLQAPYNNNVFLSIARLQNGALLLGSHANEILEVSKGHVKRHILDFQSVDLWQRNIILSQGKVFACSSTGILLDFKTWLKHPQKDEGRFESKAVMVLNDSILISGDRYRLYKINTIKAQITLLKDFHIRVTCLGSTDQHQIYFGSTDGLHKYDMNTDSVYAYGKSDRLLGERIVSMCSTPDSILWVATASYGIVAIKKDKVVLHITERQGLMTNNSLCILSGRKGQVWVGTNEGISVIQYNHNPTLHIIRIQNLTVQDGLTSDIVNQLLFTQDTIYAATNKGVSIISADISIPLYDIPIRLVSVRINQRDTSVQTYYSLSPEQDNISLQLAGVELNGHFKQAEYSLDMGQSWTALEGTNLSLKLGSGEHDIILRAMDVNGNRGTHLLKLTFDIAAPFYKTLWFVIILTLVSTTILLGLYNRRKMQKQKRLYEQELALETQRKKITADLHDDIGSMLSSLQLNSSIANRLFEKDHDVAKEVLGKIEKQSQNLSEKIGDFIWSMKPATDEFMSLSSRIKTFASDILGSTDICYEIDIDRDIDRVVREISMRKNIVLIAKEAINNIAKYSKAKQVLIALKYEAGMITIRVEDDGVGMQIEENQQAGNGMENMQKRAKELKADFEIVSAIGGGTKIRVKFKVG